MNHPTEQIVDLIIQSREEIHTNIRKNLENVTEAERRAWMAGWVEAHSQLKRVFLVEEELYKTGVK